MDWESVLTINDYYDGPRLGIANVGGTPHIYEAEFDHSADEYGDTYLVSPVEPQLLAAALEDWKIWLRWDAAYKAGEAGIDSHPALPAERARHEQLLEAMGGRLKADATCFRRVRAEFRSLRVGGAWTGTEVRWMMPN